MVIVEKSKDSPPSTIWPVAARAVSHLVFVALLASMTFFGTLMVKALLPAPSTVYPLMSFNQGSDLLVSVRPPSVPSSAPTACYASDSSDWSVIFENGSHSLDDCQRRSLAKLAIALSTCEVADIKLRGFASSAEYPSDSDLRNVTLANQRAETVADFLRSRVSKASVSVVRHSSVDDLWSSVRYVDARSDPKRENPIEFLNRKVTISLSSVSKCSFLKPTSR